MRTFDKYKSEVLADAKDYIEENIDYMKDWDDCWESMWASRVNGNGDGSYYYNAYKARKACAGMEFDQDFLDAYEWHFGGDDLARTLREGPESFDVLIRIVATEELYGELEEFIQERKEM